MYRPESDELIGWKRQRSVARAVVAFARGEKLGDGEFFQNLITKYTNRISPPHPPHPFLPEREGVRAERLRYHADELEQSLAPVS